MIKILKGFICFLILSYPLFFMESCTKGCKDRNASNYDAGADNDCAPGCCTYTNNNNNNNNNNNITSNGAIVFWTNSPYYGSYITITINGVNKSITSYLSSPPPSCLAQYGAYFYLPQGTYTYSAVSQLNYQNSGTVTVGSTCNSVLVTF